MRGEVDKSLHVTTSLAAGHKSSRPTALAVESSTAFRCQFQTTINPPEIPPPDVKPTLSGRVERCLLSPSGVCLVIGWVADEGCPRSTFVIDTGSLKLEFPPTAVLRHRRVDVEGAVQPGAYDFGYLAIAAAGSRLQLDGSLSLTIGGSSGEVNILLAPALVSDERILETLLECLAGYQAHAGREMVLADFIVNGGGSTAIDLFSRHIGMSIQRHHVERFRPRPVQHSFVTVLFGTVEPLRMQPILFRQAGIDVGEWIFVCNSPDLAEACLRLGRLVSELYDLAITIIVMDANVGFGAANNIAVAHAASEKIFLVNPDIYPIEAYAARFQGALESDLGKGLWGGLLFYDETNLMHGGMYLDADLFVRSRGLNLLDETAAESCRLLRVEHFDKGVPFDESAWRGPRSVPAVTGAFMAFDRSRFAEIGGFSLRYIYGHYEDADLCFRWTDQIGPVQVHPEFRLVHLEGQGSTSRGPHYHGAALFNRYVFSAEHAHRLGDMTRVRLAHRASSGTL